jgi:hypothetical protein
MALANGAPPRHDAATRKGHGVVNGLDGVASPKDKA